MFRQFKLLNWLNYLNLFKWLNYVNLTNYFELQIETLLLNTLHWYAVVLLCSKIKLEGGLKNNTMDSNMPRVSADFCLITSISSICLKELSKKSIDTNESLASI